MAMSVSQLVAAGRLVLSRLELDELKRALADLRAALDEAAQQIRQELRQARPVGAVAATLSLPRARRYRVVEVDLQVARPTPVPLSVHGTSLLVLWAPDGARWWLRLSHEANDPIPSRVLPTGSHWQFEFSELYLQNEPAPAGTDPLVLYVDQEE